MLTGLRGKTCPHCDTLLSYVARRTLHAGSTQYYLHVRICPNCKRAYGEAENAGQAEEPLGGKAADI